MFEQNFRFLERFRISIKTAVLRQLHVQVKIQVLIRAKGLDSLLFQILAAMY